MNDDLMFEYLVQMGAMRPEEDQLKKKQAMVDALRKQGMTSPEGQMIGKHYVAPSLAQTIAQVGSAYAANKGQQGVDASAADMNARQRQMLEELRKRKRGGMGMETSAPTDPYAPFAVGNEA